MAKPSMIRRVVVQSVTVVRDGARVTPERGKAFDFTEEEIAYLDRISPSASRRAVNESGVSAPQPQAPVVEEPEDEDEDDVEDDEPAKTPAPKKAAAKKKPAAKKTAASSDDDEDEDI